MKRQICTVLKSESCFPSGHLLQMSCWNVLFDKNNIWAESKWTKGSAAVWACDKQEHWVVSKEVSVPGRQDVMVAEKVTSLAWALGQWVWKQRERWNNSIPLCFQNTQTAILPFIVCWFSEANKVAIPRLNPRRSQSQAQNQSQTRSRDSTQNWNHSPGQMPALSSALSHQPQRN